MVIGHGSFFCKDMKAGEKAYSRKPDPVKG
jgi:hypothetical protein